MDFSPSLCVQINSDSHPSSHPMGAGGSISGVKRERAITLTTHPLLVPMWSMGYISCPPWHIHGGSGTALLCFCCYITYMSLKMKRTVKCKSDQVGTVSQLVSNTSNAALACFISELSHHCSQYGAACVCAWASVQWIAQLTTGRHFTSPVNDSCSISRMALHFNTGTSFLRISMLQPSEH